LKRYGFSDRLTIEYLPESRNNIKKKAAKLMAAFSVPEILKIAPSKNNFLQELLSRENVWRNTSKV
jgi:3-methyladenine DNA glycosylase Tag